MPANPNWARWIFASTAYALKKVATDASLPVLVEHLDERTQAFMEAPDRAEIRITGPFTTELSHGCFRIFLDANVLLWSRYDGKVKNQYNLLKNAGLFHERMDSPIAVWNYGSLAGDYQDADPSTQVFLGCLRPKPGRSESIKVFNFGQVDKIDKVKQTAVDAKFVMYIDV